MILIAGGDGDPNILAMVRRAAGRGVPHSALLVGAESPPRLVWDIARGTLSVNGAVVAPQAVVLRYDVFGPMRDERPESRKRSARWYQTMLCWALAHERVAMVNRRYGTRHVTKPLLLHLALRAGVAVPETLVASDPQPPDAAADRWIVKPVDGGEYTRVLADALADDAWCRQAAAEPVLVQRRLESPDLRVYRIGDHWFGFMLESGAIDYRVDRSLRIRQVLPPADLIVPLARLMDGLGLDFGAADYKRCPQTGRPLFLEVNSAPMFAAFDRVTGGALCDRMVDWLLARGCPTAGTERPEPAAESGRS
jgi:hypothetical protein